MALVLSTFTMISGVRELLTVLVYLQVSRAPWALAFPLDIGTAQFLPLDQGKRSIRQNCVNRNIDL